MMMVTMFWGSSYLFMNLGLHSLQAFNMIALRFGIAFIVAGLIFYRRLTNIDFKTIQYSFILGSLLFLVFSAIAFGLTSTTISNAGFLTSLTVIFVPLLLAILLRKQPEKRIVFGLFFSLTGIALLTLNQALKIHSGDILCIFGALFYAIYIIVTGKLTKNVDSLTLGIMQLGFTGMWGLVFSLMFEKPKLPDTNESWIAILALSILCSAIGFIVQAAAQKYTSPTHISFIFSAEPVYAALFAFLFAGERLPARGYVGALLILLGVLTAEMDIKKPTVKNKSLRNLAKKSIEIYPKKKWP